MHVYNAHTCNRDISAGCYVAITLVSYVGIEGCSYKLGLAWLSILSLIYAVKQRVVYSDIALNQSR